MQHRAQLVGRDVPALVHLVHVGREVHLTAHEEDVVDLVLAPGWRLAVGEGVRGPVMEAREESEVVVRQLRRLDAQLVQQLAPCRVLGARHRQVGAAARLRCVVDLLRHAAVQRVRAAGVGPHAREGDLRLGALRDEHAALRVEDEDGEGAMQPASRRLR
eukprot:scaffold26186_cov51-Phaeocystis_antarctica.AAC.4